MKRISEASLACVIACAWLSSSFQSNDGSQSKATRTVANTGDVAGVVLLVTKKADIKPARRLKAVLLCGIGCCRTNAQEQNGQTAATKFMEIDTKLNNEWDASAQKEGGAGKPSGEEARCAGLIAVQAAALQATLDWAKTSGKMKEVVTADIDEQGQFKFERVQCGHYLLLIIAQDSAGADSAFWSGKVEVEANKLTSITLSEPVFACPPRK